MKTNITKKSVRGILFSRMDFKKLIIMKNFLTKIVVSAFIFTLTQSCNEESCDYPADCVPLGQNNEVSGFTVTTFYSDQPNDFVGAVYDTRNNSSAPTGVDWAVSLNAASKITHPADWTRGKIGAVFGIATDETGNVYLASSGVYNQYTNVGAGLNNYVNINPGRIYKANAGTYSTGTFVDLPVTSSIGSLNGVGNIAYDKVNRQLFATNLDDGKIYRISNTGSILQTFDPWTADVTSPGITTQDERVWVIGVNYENGKIKLYFARITTPITSITNRNIYSITLNSDGSMPTSATPVLEVKNIPGNQAAITDIEFSADTKKMIIAERGAPHSAISTSYNRIGTSWISNVSQYFVGETPGYFGKNSAGGVDFQYKGNDKGINCEEFVWASGNLLIASGSATATSYIYGIQGIAYPGNNSTTSSSTDLFIDFDNPNYTWNTGIGKGEIGDVDSFDADGCFCVKK